MPKRPVRRVGGQPAQRCEQEPSPRAGNQSKLPRSGRAEHYGVARLQAQARKPGDKAKIEVGVMLNSAGLVRPTATQTVRSPASHNEYWQRKSLASAFMLKGKTRAVGLIELRQDRQQVTNKSRLPNQAPDLVQSQKQKLL